MRLDARIVCAVVTSFGIALAGCGGSSDSGTTPPPPPPPPAGPAQNFDSLALDTPFDTLGWAPENITAVVAVDPLVATNKALKITSGNFNAGTIVKLTIPDGKTLADYNTFEYRAYFVDGDLVDKDLQVLISKDMPTEKILSDASGAAGFTHRVGGTDGKSTEWETIDITLNNVPAGLDAATGDVYFLFGSNNSGSTYYADDIKLLNIPAT